MNAGGKSGGKNPAVRILRSRKFYVIAAAIILYALSGFFLLPYLVQRYAPRILAQNLNATAEIGAVRINPFRLTLEAEGFELRDPDNHTIGGFGRLLVNLELSSMIHWAWTFSEVRFDAPLVSVVFEPDGRINLAKLVPSGKDSEPAPDDARPPRVLLRNIAIENGEVEIIDRRQQPAAEVRLRPLNFELRQISTLPERRGPYNLIASTPQGESLHWSGEVNLNPLQSVGTVLFQNIEAATLWAFVRNRIDLDPPAGSLDVSTTYELRVTDGTPQLTLSNLGLQLSDLALKRSDAPEPFLKLADATVSAGGFDLQSRRLDVNQVTLEGGQMSLAIGEDGIFNVEKILRRSSENRTAAVEDRTPDATGAAWNVRLNRFRLDNFGLTFSRPGLTASLENASIGFGLEATAQPGSMSLNIRELTSTLSGLRGVPQDAEQPPLVIEEIALEGGRFDLEPQQFSATRIAVVGGNLDLVRENDGDINLVRMFSLPERSGIQQRREDALDKGRAFRFQAATLSVSELSATISDKTVAVSEPILIVDPINLTITDFDGQSSSRFETDLRVRQGGSLAASGSFDPAGPSLQADLKLEQLSLRPLEPYLQAVARVRLPSGTLSSSGKLQYGASPSFDGGFQVASLEVTEEGSGDLLIGWKRMDAPNLSLALQPDRLNLGEVTLDGFFGKLIIHKDGTINLANVLKDPARSEKPPSAKNSSEEAPFPVTVERVRFRDSQLDFADFTLPTPFATLIHELEGIIAGISTKTDARAQVELDGQVDEYGTAAIVGEINAFDPLAFTDVTMRFRNVEMSNLSPYSARFAGRRIEGGKLSLDLEYKIDRNQLEGDNQIVVERLDLGERVQSPEAVNLPLDLAVALLSDADGVIDIGLPVRGDLNDPEFSFGHLIWKALANLITKVVTSPFRLLASLAGSEEENLDAVAFEPGRSEVPPPEREKLHALAEALAQRPQLNLVVQGRYAPEADGRQLRAMQLRRELALRTGRTLEPGEDPGQVNFNSPRIHAALQELYVEAFGEEAYEALQEPEVGAPDPKESAVEEDSVSVDPNRLWKTLFEQLIPVQPLDEATMTELARDRAQAVVAEITGDGGIAPGRVATAEPESTDSDGTVKARLSLEAG
jgi:hypothetical protein